MSQRDHYWSCPCSGVRRDVINGVDNYICYRCGTHYTYEQLEKCGLTGNEPVKFGERLNRLFDGD